MPRIGEDRIGLGMEYVGQEDSLLDRERGLGIGGTGRIGPSHNTRSEGEVNLLKG